MKKLIAVLILMLICAAFCSCTLAGGKQIETENNTDYKILVNSGSVFVYEIKDADTGVWYICTKAGITPKLNADGTLFTEKGGAEK